LMGEIDQLPRGDSAWRASTAVAFTVAFENFHLAFFRLNSHDLLLKVVVVIVVVVIVVLDKCSSIRQRGYVFPGRHDLWHTPRRCVTGSLYPLLFYQNREALWIGKLE